VCVCARLTADVPGQSKMDAIFDDFTAKQNKQNKVSVLMYCV